jgi:predicted DsbA family dithiol-disulfide isomerase
MRVRLAFDLVCPYSYMESFAAEAAEDEGLLEIEWLPFELRPPGRPLLEPRGDHLRVDWTRNVYRRAQAFGIEIHLPRYQPRSTLPLSACLWAAEQGRGRELRRALYAAFFCEGEDISAEAQITLAAHRVGLDPVGAVEAAYGRTPQLAALRRDLEATGVRGVPGLLTEDGRSHWGMTGIQRLLAGEPLVPRD